MPGSTTLRIEQIIPETREAATLVLSVAEGAPLIYQPGQFLTLLFDGQGQQIRRSYSFSSSPAWSEPPAITLKRKTNGEISRYLVEQLREGELLSSLEPSGIFTLSSPTDPPRDIFLFGAGSGISPLFSLLKTALKEEPASRITLVYSNTSEDSVIFLKPLRALESIYDSQFSCIHILSRPHSEMKSIWGHLGNGLVEELVTRHLHFNWDKAMFMLCGPLSYMRMVAITLYYMGFRADQIRRENFVVPPAPLLPAALRQPRTIRLISGPHENLIRVPANESILQAALDQGIDLPYSCKGGVCSTCRCRLLKGKVKMTLNEVLTEKDLEQGWVLTCTGYPEDDEVILEKISG